MALGYVVADQRQLDKRLYEAVTCGTVDTLLPGTLMRYPDGVLEMRYRMVGETLDQRLERPFDGAQACELIDSISATLDALMERQMPLMNLRLAADEVIVEPGTATLLFAFLPMKGLTPDLNAARAFFESIANRIKPADDIVENVLGSYAAFFKKRGPFDIIGFSRHLKQVSASAMLMDAGTTVLSSGDDHGTTVLDGGDEAALHTAAPQLGTVVLSDLDDDESSLFGAPIYQPPAPQPQSAPAPAPEPEPAPRTEPAQEPAPGDDTYLTPTPEMLDRAPLGNHAAPAPASEHAESESEAELAAENATEAESGKPAEAEAESATDKPADLEPEAPAEPAPAPESQDESAAPEPEQSAASEPKQPEPDPGHLADAPVAQSRQDRTGVLNPIDFKVAEGYEDLFAADVTDRAKAPVPAAPKAAPSHAAEPSASKPAPAAQPAAEVPAPAGQDAPSTAMPAPRRMRFYLTRIATGERFEVRGRRFVVGKSKHSSFMVRGTTTVSRSHAIFVTGPDTCTIEDDNSRNGTFVNNERLDPGFPVELVDGDTVRLSDENFAFEVEPA